jgi:phenylalanyl-tRNA synthetase beta chain
MKFTLSWLQQYVKLGDISADRLADDLTMLGLEVDTVLPQFTELSSLKTAKVISTEPHPNAEKLTLCQVAVGDESLQIICGADNVRPDLCAVIALPGTTLPGNFKIKKSKIRGVESQGMLCSEDEIGLGDNHDGIIELPDGTPHGESFLECSGLGDTQIEVDLTPNRPDCASVIGIAREVAGRYRAELNLDHQGSKIESEDPAFTVEIEDAELCPRYAGRLIKGVTIKQSPWWLKKRLLSVGQRPINNIVDITNLVMLEYGQPLHAFDFHTLAGQKIVVRTPRPKETHFTTLDNVSRPLQPDTLMICDGEKPVAVAGVMGGLESEVTDSTVDVLLESACFNAISIRRTSRLLNLSTDASYRFERGVDPDGTINAMERAVTLMCDLAGGTAEPCGHDVYPGKKPLLALQLRVSRTNELLGLELSAEEMAEHLESIELGCAINDPETITVTVPSFRVDIEREVDLVEEIARLVGFNNIPVTLPGVDLSYPIQENERLRRIEASAIMTRAGFSEAINYSFLSADYDDHLELAADDRRRSHVHIMNPLTEDQDVMRTSLLPGLLENVRRNLSFQQTSCRLFEIGKLFFPVPGEKLADETGQIAGVLVGNRYGSQSPLHFTPEDVDIYDAKGAVENLLTEMQIPCTGDTSRVSLQPSEPDDREPFCEDGYELKLHYQDKVLGSVGKFRNDILRAVGIKREVFYFDLDFATLCSIKPVSKEFFSLPVYPAVKRDIALVVPADTPAGDLVQTVLSSREKLVEQCDVFDVYQGGAVKSGHKSVALAITYRSETKTLTEKNVEKAHAKVVKLLTDSFGGVLREE